MTIAQERTLEFGTGGIRGIMGPNAEQMNEQTVKRVVQGICNYFNSLHSMVLPLVDAESRKVKYQVVIAFDSRHNSDLFARIASCVFAANNIQTYLFSSLETTPLLSFAVRYLNCSAGLCITASHNPPQYNGIKVYWSDGAQIVPPIDQDIIQSIYEIGFLDEIPVACFEEAQKSGLVQFVGKHVQEAYFKDVRDTLKKYFNFDKNDVVKNTNLSIVYTPLHGTGYHATKSLFDSLNFKNVFIVPEQKDPDGSFPTVKKPNPEEPQALSLALQYAHEKDADIVFATDPDADRLAVCVKDPRNAHGLFQAQSQGDYVLLNGNQTGALLLYFILESLQKKGV